MRPTYNPPRRDPRWPYDSAAQPPRPPARMPPQPLVPATVPTGHSQILAQGAQYQFQTSSGTLLGNVLPLIADPGSAPVDGRTCALQALGRYLTEVPYRRRGNKVDPSAQPGLPPAASGLLPPGNFYVDDPDPETDMVYPSITCAGGPVEKTPHGFTPNPDATTVDVYGAGTVVVPMWTHSEEVTLHVYASQLGLLRGLMSMVEQMLVPADGVGGTLLVMPDYYGETARFTLTGSEWERDDGAIRNRRSAVHKVRLDFNVVRLVAYALMTPNVTVDVETPAYASASTAEDEAV